MPITKAQLGGFFKKIMEIDLFGTAPPNIPFPLPASVEGVLAAIDSGRSALPLVYRDGYITPLEKNLAAVLATGDVVLLETLAGAAYEHSQQRGVTPQVHRFLAVISNLYRSFLSAKRRAAADFPIVEQFPPLAAFKHTGEDGPFTLPVDTVRRIIGSDVGVVSLPAIYRDHPVLWAALCHEVGGHDVLHADDGLLPELESGVRAFFGGGPIGPGGKLNEQQFLGLLWSYWMDEAASDVFGVLNIGPSFGLNLAVFFGALNAQAQKPQGQAPILRSQSGSDENGDLDPHPTDILRLHLILGAVESLQALSQDQRSAYAEDLLELADMCAPNVSTIRLQGTVLGGPGVRVPVNVTLPFDEMQKTARRVGSFIATARLNSLGGHSIQELETWDDADEEVAQRISQSLQKQGEVTGMGDDAQLLAGATLALFEDSSLYTSVTGALVNALNLSFDQDPIFGKAQKDHVYLRIASRSQARSKAWQYTVIGGKASPVKANKTTRRTSPK